MKWLNASAASAQDEEHLLTNSPGGGLVLKALHDDPSPSTVQRIHHLTPFD